MTITDLWPRQFTFALRWTGARLTSGDDHWNVHKRTLLTALALAAALATSVSAQAGAAPAPSLPPGWWHAQINVVIRHQPHTLIYDRGKVQSLTPTSLTLKERDGISVTITVDSNTVVKVDG